MAMGYDQELQEEENLLESENEDEDERPEVMEY
jgi:hypothetical protein